MKNVERGSRSWIAAACLSALLANGTCAQQMPDAIDVEETAAVQPEMVPYGFIENKGQVLDQHRKQNHAVRYLLPGDRFNVALKPNGYSYDLYSDETPRETLASAHDHDGLHHGELQERKLRIQRVDLRFEGTSGEGAWSTAGVADDHLNVINEHGSFELLRHYGQVTQHELYPGVDIRYATREGGFKQDIITTTPEALEQVRFRIAGAQAKADGKALLISTSEHSFAEEIPLSYVQRADGSKEPLEVIYVAHADGSFGFQNTTRIADWKQGDRLVVDPVNRIRGSYFNGTNGTTDFFAVLSGSYMAGFTTSTIGLATAGTHDNTFNGNADAVLVRMTNCTRTWATYYGGAGLDIATCLAWPKGDNVNLLIGGYTPSSGVFGTTGVVQPTYGGGTHDGFLAKFLTSTGQRTWGTYCGGSGTDLILDVASDDNGNPHVVGVTSSSGMATTVAHDNSLGGTEDAFWRSYNTNATVLLYSTYYGGAGTDIGYSIEVVGGKTVYICGHTNSTASIGTAGTHQPTKQPGIDAFLAKFTAGVRDWGTYYGGGQDDIAYGLALVGCGDPMIAGTTYSNNLIAFGSTPHQGTLGGGGDACLARFSSINGTIVFGTYYGGSDYDFCLAIVSSGSDLVYVGGQTGSTTSIATTGSWQSTFGGGLRDGWVARFSTIGSLVSGTYYGGAGIDNIRAISTGPSAGNLTIVGNTNSATGIASAGCFDVTVGANGEAFYATFDGPIPAACSLPGGMQMQVDIPASVQTKVFPVPFADVFTIHTVLDDEADAYLRLVDLTGRTVLTQPLGRLAQGANFSEVQCPGLADGMYTWILNVGDAVSTGSVVRSAK
ncbi:MAG: hypothetical protein JNJ91_11720 [Flavobacteriales bacterium]|nr:hypothetical protein [Flavobacteriales bacterium]